MKRIVTLLMVVTMLFSPVSVQASSIQYQSDEIDRFDVEITHHGKIETDSDGFIILDQDDYWRTNVVAFKPEVYYAQRSSDKLVLNVNVTTASELTTIQISTDRNFPKDINKTRTFTITNRQCYGTVLMEKHWREKEVTYKNGNVRYSAYVYRTFYQGKRNLTFRQKPIPNVFVDLPATQSIVDRVRQQVKLEKRFVINDIKRGTEYYVKIRNRYKGNTKDVVYSQTVFKVVRK